MFKFNAFYSIIEPRLAPYTQPVENSMGNLDPTGVFHNRCTSPQRKVGTGCAIGSGGFGNPGLNREIGSSQMPRQEAQLIFDVTNLKKVGGSISEPSPHQHMLFSACDGEYWNLQSADTLHFGGRATFSGFDRRNPQTESLARQHGLKTRSGAD